VRVDDPAYKRPLLIGTSALLRLLCKRWGRGQRVRRGEHLGAIMGSLVLFGAGALSYSRCLGIRNGIRRQRSALGAALGVLAIRPAHSKNDDKDTYSYGQCDSLWHCNSSWS
jgi:hypothetical protein